jgi:hypothetical protein
MAGENDHLHCFNWIGESHIAVAVWILVETDGSGKQMIHRFALARHTGMVRQPPDDSAPPNTGLQPAAADAILSRRG